MMRIRPVSTRITLLLAAIVLLTPLIASAILSRPLKTARNDTPCVASACGRVAAMDHRP